LSVEFGIKKKINQKKGGTLASVVHALSSYNLKKVGIDVLSWKNSEDTPSK
jgi:hypothetical protein